MSSMNRFLSGVIRAPSDWNSYGDNHFQSAGCPAPAATRHSHPTPSASLRHSIPQSGLVHRFGCLIRIGVRTAGGEGSSALLGHKPCPGPGVLNISGDLKIQRNSFDPPPWYSFTSTKSTAPTTHPLGRSAKDSNPAAWIAFSALATCFGVSQSVTGGAGPAR